MNLKSIFRRASAAQRLGDFLSSVMEKSSGNKLYRECPHCQKQLSLKIFREHKKLHYNASTKMWTKALRDDASSRNDTSSSFEFMEEPELRTSSDTDDVSSTLLTDENSITELGNSIEDTFTTNSSKCTM